MPYQETQMTIQQRYQELSRKRESYLSRCEQYARWTLPWLFPEEDITRNRDNEVIPSTFGAIGARCVNHVSNKLIEVLFPTNRPFYRANLGEKTKALAEAQGVDTAVIEEAMGAVERGSMRTTNVAKHRAKSSYAAKLLVITGNALMYYVPTGNPDESRDVVVYSLRNYVIERAWNGRVIEIITRDVKQFGGFSDEVRSALQTTDRVYKYNDEITLYTCIKYDSKTNKYHVKQAANDIDIATDGRTSTVIDPNLLPWVPLTWNLVDGEHYGRGLVEDYQLDFNAYNVFTQSQTEMVSIMADIKRFVRAQSGIDPHELDAAPAGETFVAEPGDIWYAEMSGKQFDLSALTAKIQELEQRLSSAFLLTSASVRRAERVTAEEIRMQITELETALGGIYSKLAMDWQMPLARILLSDIGIAPTLDITPLIITGMDAMSRSAETESVYMVFQDLALVSNLAELGQYVNMDKYLTFCCTNRGVERGKIFNTAEEMQQMQQQAAAQQQALIEQQSNIELDKAAMQQEG